ncbi:MAG TPA: double-strand break repair helicase AddA [Xanthobacteraceae bacterium]|jgi:ATP-dependent helicase/nuclease subunit A|nr:double-strand break repair helicase AddA [Xanthobacteraceae bacterium]
MRTADDIPPQVRELQRAVAAPDASAWVAANAGSGKTHVLAQRVINLLLDGVAPEKILCITFTKAAAANMAKRVFDTLATWTTLDDTALDKAIHEGSGIASDARQRTAARRLFARALETPGGLKVQTIHAFCTQLLHQFPFEANVAARFTVLDEAQQTQLLEQITLHVLLDGARNPQSPLGCALAVAMTAAADQTFREVIRTAIGRRDTIARWVMREGDVAPAIAALSRALGIEPTTSRDSVENEFFADSAIAPAEWAAVAATLARGNKTDIEQAERFNQLAALPRADRVETYLDIFFTANERTPRKSIATKAIKDPRLTERLIEEQERVGALLQRLRAVTCRDRSAALLTVTYDVLTRYHSEKERRGLVDYDDLIDKTLALLSNVDAAWVHYKLDLGIDHLLIDEAQDTSHKQWQIVRQLVAEFTAGAGVHLGTRTIFAVGDEKQSIYSFQNAAPREFAQMRSFFERAHSHGGLKFVFKEFKHSFRSGASVLAAVDEVFKDKLVAASVSSDTDGFPPHIALPDAPPSQVEIWQPTEPDERADIEGWDAPFDTVSETSPRVKLAKRIARVVRRMVESGEPVGIDRRAARYGDILVLVRQRGELFEAVIRALKNEHVEVAGADRLILTEHIAVMDLMALADALLLPQDDLALATVLRSPLFGFSDDDLFAVAYDRGRLSLREALKRKAAEGELVAASAQAKLDRFAEAARRETPFAFYGKILGADGARQHFLARLGAEANDALDEFLNLAIEYERRETPSLQGFMAWLREARAEVKRDMEIARDEVRVMTVHGAKGLEAPIVFLADTMTPPAGPRPPRLLELPGSAVIWVTRKADDPPAAAAARQDAQREAADEYRRLLYVAMTRAADRLIVCGAQGDKRRPDGCWYDLVCEPLKPFLVEESDGEDKVLRYRTGTNPVAERREAAPALQRPDRPEVPAWLRQRAAPETPRVGPLSPSVAFDEDIARFTQPGASATARRKAMERGRIVHRLMQSLPDIPPERRADAIERFLARTAKDFSPAERAEIARQMSAVLDNKDFAEIFTPGSRPEVPIIGHVPRDGAAPLEVAGQVDRLSFAGDTVLIADYKTDGIVPRTLEDVPPHYVTQLALYRAVLGRLYAGKTIRAALVFTGGPLLLEVPAKAMDAALEAVLCKVLT